MNSTENIDELVKTIINNNKKITDFINELLKIIYNNITLPYIHKSIYIIIDVLIDKKYSNKKFKILKYQKLMFLSKYLIGNVILSLVTNPNYIFKVATDVISKTTKDNLEIFTKIFKKNAFSKLSHNKSEPEYSILNKYIVLAFPKKFFIINYITFQKRIYIKNKILFNSVNDIYNPNRNIIKRNLFRLYDILSIEKSLLNNY